MKLQQDGILELCSSIKNVLNSFESKNHYDAFLLMSVKSTFRNLITKAFFSGAAVEAKQPEPQMGWNVGTPKSDIFKAYIPWFLYKPPYGFPRDVNVIQLRTLAKNPYVFSVIKTLQDEVSAVRYDIFLKEDCSQEGDVIDEEVKMQIKNFFRHPNKNGESFEHLVRSWVRDICEVDAGVGVKIFNQKGEFSQLFARDGGTFLKNPDIYGYIGDRVDIVVPPTRTLLTGGLPGDVEKGVLESFEKGTDYAHFFRNQLYDDLYQEKAAYFQYGWTAGARPVPFGKREIVYMMANPRTDSIYGRSPIEILHDTILTLVYGGEYNLDFYLNNNTPAGFMSIEGASTEQLKAWREQLQSQYMFEDNYGNTKKKHFKSVFTNLPVKHVPIQLTSKDMEVLEQQKWFTKLVWSCFGVTPTEMGYTEDVNKAVAVVDDKVVKRKAVRPLLSVLQYHINTFIMPEFGHPELEFRFIDYDLDEDLKQHQLYEAQIRMGLKTANEIRTEELGLEELEITEPEKEEFEDKEDKDKDVEKKSGFGKVMTQREMAKLYREMQRDQWYAKDEDAVPLEKDVAKRLKEVRKEINEELKRELAPSYLAEIKGGYVNIKSKFKNVTDKYKGIFDGEDFKVKVNKYMDKSISKGIEDIEKNLQINTAASPNEAKEVYEFVQENLKDLADELMNKIRKEVTIGVLNGELPNKIRQRIKKQFDLAETRAKTIARTESNRAENIGNYLAAKKSGLKLKKKWAATVDNRTSDICLGLNGKVVKMDEKFRDINGNLHELPPAHPNCRSRVIYVQE